ncbi:MAG: outer membrane protein transport protein [Loktanella sp.]|nr:outer membrane protein transport protein [Loktanella sp.]
MKQTLTIGAALLLTTSMAHAVGLDRSNQNIGIIFQDGNYAELSFGYVMPNVSGRDLEPFSGPPFNGGSSGNVAENYSILGLGYKTDINEQMSFSLIIDEPYGADISYPTGESVALGGTAATLDSVAVTGILRYKLNDNISFHGGVRAQSTSASVTLDGFAYGFPPAPPPLGINGYSVDFQRHTGFGYVLGGAYEIPEIALRVAITYFSEIEHRFQTSDNLFSSEPTIVTTPQAVNLDFQTGIAADTLLFGSVRWAEYSVVKVEPENFPRGSLTNIEDGFGYTLGVGRRFSDVWSGSFSVGYEPEGADLVSPLAPTNGNYSVGVGAQYTMDNVILSGGVRYIVPGDASAQTADTARARFEDNSAVAVGLKVAYTY